MLRARISSAGLRPGERVHLNLCLDEDCATAEGRLGSMRDGFLPNKPVVYADDVDLGARGDIHAYLDGDELVVEVDAQYDDHADLAGEGVRDFRLEVFRQGSNRDAAINIDTEAPFDRQQPNGPDCEPVCWRADLDLT